MRDLSLGFTYLLAGFELIFKPGLRKFVVFPLLINLLFFIALFFLFKHYVSEFNLWFESHLPQWLHWLSMVLWLLFIVSFFLIFIFAFVTMANIIAAPFNGLLAEKVEFFLTGIKLEERSFFQLLKDMPRIIGRQLLILGYYLPRAFLIFILFFIPVVHALAAVLWFFFNAWLMTLTYIDYPTDNHRIALRQVHSWLREKRWVGIGFGVSVLVTTMIPIINFLVMPAAVAGATKFWVEQK